MAWNDLGVVSPGPRGGQEGKGSGRVGRGSGASCLQPALGGALGGHSGTMKGFSACVVGGTEPLVGPDPTFTGASRCPAGRRTCLI